MNHVLLMLRVIGNVIRGIDLICFCWLCKTGSLTRGTLWKQFVERLTFNLTIVVPSLWSNPPLPGPEHKRDVRYNWTGRPIRQTSEWYRIYEEHLKRRKTVAEGYIVPNAYLFFCRKHQYVSCISLFIVLNRVSFWTGSLEQGVNVGGACVVPTICLKNLILWCHKNYHLK